MEMMGIIRGLNFIDDNVQQKEKVKIYTDSKYVTDNVPRLRKWKANAWRTYRDGKVVDIKNIDLWKLIDEMIAKHTLSFHWVKGHNGDERNERVNDLAQMETALRKG